MVAGFRFPLVPVRDTIQQKKSIHPPERRMDASLNCLVHRGASEKETRRTLVASGIPRKNDVEIVWCTGTQADADAAPATHATRTLHFRRFELFFFHVFFRFLPVLQAILAIGGVGFFVGMMHQRGEEVAVQKRRGRKVFVPIIRKRAIRIMRETRDHGRGSLDGVAVDIAADGE